MMFNCPVTKVRADDKQKIAFKESPKGDLSNDPRIFILLQSGLKQIVIHLTEMFDLNRFRADTI